MHDVLSQVFLTSLISGGIVAGVPLMFAGLGETIAERAGILNIGLEGYMLFGAYTGFLGAYYGHSVWLGFLAGAAAGALVSLVMVGCCVRLSLNQIVIGIVILLAGQGVTSVLQIAQFGTTYPRLDAAATLPIPGLSKIPVVGASVFEQPAIVYLGIVLIVASAWMLRRSRMGLNLRAAGERPESLDAAGVSVTATRAWATVAAGAFSGLGGAFLSIVAAGIFVPFMTNGQGFIALVVAMLARGRPLRVVVGALIFGLASSISTALQLIGVDISADVVNMLPFIAVMIALVLFGRQAYLPPALAIPYERGRRGA